MKKISFLFLLTLVVWSCKSGGSAQQRFSVKHKGALKNIMHKGELAAVADLEKLAKTENTYALGAVENLKGEILILDGEPFVSSVRDGKVHIDNSFNHKAVLLVYTTVSRWNTNPVPEDVGTLGELEKYVAKVAGTAGIDMEEPFPFLLEGTAKSFDWHVIDWLEGDTVHSHEKHVNSGLNGTMENRKVQILGFYSSKHHAVFTHHTTNMHLHVRTIDGEIAGHIDSLELGAGMQLKLPSVEKR